MRWRHAGSAGIGLAATYDVIVAARHSMNRGRGGGGGSDSIQSVTLRPGP